MSPTLRPDRLLFVDLLLDGITNTFAIDCLSSSLHSNKMRSSLVLLCLALACLTATQAASYRRGDKISEHFKQLDLPPEEIDPNVAPLDSMNEVIFDNEVVDQAEELADAVVTEDEVIEEAGQSVATTVTPVAAAAVATSAPAATAVTAAAPVKAEEEGSPLAKYCKCSGNHCDCCRAFNLPFIPVKGPGCARMSYLGNEKMAVSLKYGDLTLITRTVSSKRARPICVGLPGGYSQFCGRVYGLSKAKEDFKACLGFELRADDEVEAALRVSCFKFGPDGLKVADAEPLPSEAVKQEDDDDDDIFGFAAGGDDDDEDDYDEDNDEDEEDDEADDDEEADADYADDDADNEEAPADADYGGFSLAGLLDELDDDDEDETKPSSSTPVVASPATVAPAEATRTVESVQSKDDKGTEATEAAEALADEAAAAAVDVASLVDVPATETTSDTPVKTRKSKKSKKNKKKKAASTGGDFAYDLLNGLLDFFN